MAGKYRTIKRDVAPPRRTPLGGQDRYGCVSHGFVVDALKGSGAWCPCGRKAKVTAEGPERESER